MNLGRSGLDLWLYHLEMASSLFLFSILKIIKNNTRVECGLFPEQGMDKETLGV